jgi:hypothetical protein
VGFAMRFGLEYAAGKSLPTVTHYKAVTHAVVTHSYRLFGAHNAQNAYKKYNNNINNNRITFKNAMIIITNII